MNILQTDTVRLNTEKDAIEIIDQTLLPARLEIRALKTQEEIIRAICRLEVRGAPAIGVCAAYGVCLAANDIRTDDRESFLAALEEKAQALKNARPTAVNLSWAVDRMMDAARKDASLSVPEIRARLFDEAEAMHRQDTDVCARIGQYGRPLIKDGYGILTHCNAGQLATTKYGTALAPVYKAFEDGLHIRVYADETRPLLQGARLTASELKSAGVPVTLLCDNMASFAMMNKLIDIVFTGCDRVARNGDAANKIGTSGVAVLARHYGIPFYICAPISSIDFSCPDGNAIPIEMRSPDEVTDLWYKERMAPEGIDVLNPAFDVTPASLITGFITEKGIFAPDELIRLQKETEDMA